MTHWIVAFKAHLGWVNAVGIASDDDDPGARFVKRIELFEGAPREAVEPYHVAGGWQGLEQVEPPDNPAEIVARGKALQLEAATRVLGELDDRLDGSLELGVVLTGRGINVGLEHDLDSHAHIHVAEGRAVREAIRGALDQLDVAWVDYDEKSILGAAAATRGEQEKATDAVWRENKPATTRKWAKEERLLAMAAWLNRDLED